MSWPIRTGGGSLCHGPLGQELVVCIMAIRTGGGSLCHGPLGQRLMVCIMAH